MTTISISAKILSDRLTNLSKAFRPGGCAIPIYDTYHFTVKEDSVRIVASDSSIFMCSLLPATETIGEGQYCVPSKGLAKTIKGFGEQLISLTFKDNNALVISYAGGKIVLGWIEPISYELSGSLGFAENQVSMVGSQFVDGVKNCINCTATDDVRPALAGILLDVDHESVSLVATDGRRVCVTKYLVPGASTCSWTHVINKKVAKILSSLTFASINIRISGDLVKYSTDIYSVVCANDKDLKYPNYKTAVPSCDVPLSFDRKAMLSALSRMSSFCDQTTGLVIFKACDNALGICGRDVEIDTYITEKISCSNPTGSSASVGLNVSYFIEMLQGIKEDSVTMWLYNDGEQIDRVILSIPEKDTVTTTRLMMAMKIGDLNIAEEIADNTKAVPEVDTKAIDAA